MPAPLRDVGVRAPVADAVVGVEGACADPYVCSVSDVNGDGKADLVRRVLGAGVEAALSNGWSFGPFRDLGSCGKQSLCRLADLDGQPGAELLGVDLTSGALAGFSTPLETPADSPTPLPGAGMCSQGASSCSAFNLDGDAFSELAWVTDNGDLFAADPQTGSSGPVLTGACGTGQVCSFFEMTSTPGADLVVWNASTSGVTIFDLSMTKPIQRSIDCSGGRCAVADMDADGLGDIVQWAGTDVAIWSAASGWDEPVQLDWGNVWNPWERTVWADVNDDGYDDLLRIDASGAVYLHLNLDARGRLQAAALALTKLELGQARALRTAGRQEAGSSVQEGPEPLGDHVFDAQRSQLRTEVEAAIAELMNAVGSEASITTDEDARWVQQLSMMAAAGRTIIAAGPFGVGSRGDDCPNTVVQSVGDEDGALRQSPSYLFAYADALVDSDSSTRTPALIDAMTATSAGFRCINNDELQRLDAALTDAVLETANELYAAGHRLAPKWLVDDALPLALLTFDAVKYNAVPTSYQLLSAQIDGEVYAGPAPTEDFDFDTVGDDPGCNSFLCQTYGNPRRLDPASRGLMLDQLGVWLADPTRSGRLSAVDIDPHELLASLLDLRNLGEGDCPLFEVVSGGFKCRSPRTCETATGVDGAPLDPLGDALAPGVPGAELSHLLTARADLGEHNGCAGGDGAEAGGGAAAALGCLGPALGSRRGRFSRDPELDNLFRCSLEAGSAPVDVALNLGDMCIAGQDGGDDVDEPTEAVTPEQTETFEDTRENVGNMLRHSTSPYFESLVSAILRQYGDTPGVTRQKVTVALREAADVIDAAAVDELPGHNRMGSTRPASGGGVEVRIDLADLGDYAAETGRSFGDAVWNTLVHEAVHVATANLVFAGYDIGRTEARDHSITNRLGLNQMCADGPCDDSCGAGDSVFGRFAECIDGDDDSLSLEDVQCEFAEDVCSDRRLGDMGFPMTSECAPELPETAANPECYVVQCGMDLSSLANACCSAEKDPASLPPLESFISPGPRPPRPTFERFFTDVGGFSVDLDVGAL